MKERKVYWLETNNTTWSLNEIVKEFELTKEEQKELKDNGKIRIKREGYEEFEDGFEISL